MPRSINIGERYIVAWKTGHKHVADIVELRPMKKKRHLFEASSDDLGNEDFEYYVHYLYFDRRLDEWVSLERIDLVTVAPPCSEHPEPSKARKNRRRQEDASADGRKEEKEAQLLALEKENEEITKVKNINTIVLGNYDIDTWYYSPYPEEFCGEEMLFICEYCLKYMKNTKTYTSHSQKCQMKSPPGLLIYRDENISMFEIDGQAHKLYCQNLCLLSKLFLDHKTLYYDVDPFMFYVLCEVDEHGCHHIVGYFSKEKHSQENYNLACILTFPPYQRKGYGKLLISISYELTKREGTVGSPEKPLSDLGRISYRSYWGYVLLTIFQDKNLVQSVSIEQLSKMTGIRTDDIVSTCHSLNIVKYWKGQHIISIKNKDAEKHLQEAKKIRLCKPECLQWQPPEKAIAKAKIN